MRKIRGMTVTVFEKHGEWRYCIKQKKHPVLFPYVRYATEAEAMVGVFEWVERFG